jgi:hypothetical protein
MDLNNSIILLFLFGGKSGSIIHYFYFIVKEVDLVSL